MKKYLLYTFGILGSILFLLGCKGNRGDASVVRTINFRTDVVDFNSFFIGSYFDKTQEEDIVYFVDKKNCIKRYFLSGKELDSIPLYKAIELLKTNNDKLRIVSVFSRDTILVLSDYANTILSINSKGDVFGNKPINKILPDSLIGLVGIDNCFSANSNSDYHNLIYTFYPKKDYYSKYLSGLDTLKLYERMLKENKIDFELPYFVNVKNLYSNDLKNNLVIDDYAHRHYKEGDFIFRFNDFKVINNKLFVLPLELNKISIYSLNNFKHLNDLEITSNHTNVGYPPQTIKEYLEGDGLVQMNGRIQYIYYNILEKNYYVIISHTAKNEAEFISSGNGKFSAFSVIIYDKDFKKQQEYPFEANKYACCRSYMTTKGLIIQRKPENLNINNYGVQTFDLFSFN